MPHLVLRSKFNLNGPADIMVSVQGNTFEYLMTTTSDSVKVSTYLDRDWDVVAPIYDELFISEEFPVKYKITKVIPGSRTRKDIQLPGPMKNGEQLIVHVSKISASS